MKRTVAALALAATSCAQTAPPEAATGSSAQAGLDRLADQLGYRFTVVDNRPDCPGGAGGCFISEIEVTTPADLAPALRDRVEIRFGYVSRIMSVESDMFESRLINGDLNALVLKPGRSLAPGTRYKVRIVGAGHFYSAAYPMPNAHLMAPGLEGRTIAATRPKVDPETGMETLPFVAPMTDEARLATGSPEDRTQWLTPERAFARYAERGALAAPVDTVILPRPARVERPGGAALDLTGGVRLSLAGVARGEVAAALAQLADAGVAGFDRGPALSVSIRPLMAAEGYRLTALPQGITIEAADAAGASHALRSLAQQVLHEKGRLAPIRVEDAPRYPFRGLHIDVARNFHGKAQLLRLIEQMAAVKLNKLHLHLADDEGWRFEVKALPELAEVGGFRCYDDSETRCVQPQLGAAPERDAPTNGYLSQDDYLELLAVAKARQIEVIPSLDMPGHSRAAIKAMEARYRRLTAEGRHAEAERFRLAEPGDTTQYRSIQNYDDNTLNVCIDSTYRFVDLVVDELSALHARAGTPLKTYHIGADETAGAWSESPACKAMMAKTGMTVAQLGPYFIERVSNGLAARGIRPAGWSDGMGHTDPARMPKDVQTNIWGGLFTGGVKEANAQANRGWMTVLSMPDFAYLDMPNAPHPAEPGYDWAAREVETFKIFAWMPDNLPANAALATDILARPAALDDAPALDAGRHIDGLQAQLWSETIRTDAGVDYMYFPRILALAERAWRRSPWEIPYVAGQRYAHGDARVDRAALLADWRDFAQRSGAALERLDRAGIAYRVAPPGARIRNGRLETLTEFPGVRIEYRIGAGGWQPYAGPVAVDGPVTVRTRSFDGKRASRPATVLP